MSSINPYAPPMEPKSIGPIQFQGKVTVENLGDSAKPLELLPPNQRWIGRIWTVGFFGIATFHVVQGWSRGDEIAPVLWLFGALTLLFGIWLPVVMYSLNHSKGPRTRLKRLCQRSDQGLYDRRGWIDSKGITMWLPGLAAKVAWDCYTAGEVWPEMIRLPDKVDDRLRTILPWDHFGSAADFLAVQTHLKEMGAQSIREAPSHAHVQDLFGDLIHAFDFSTRDADDWAADRWPPQGTPVEHHKFLVELSAGKTWLSQLTQFTVEAFVAAVTLAASLFDCHRRMAGL